MAINESIVNDNTFRQILLNSNTLNIFKYYQKYSKFDIVISNNFYDKCHKDSMNLMHIFESVNEKALMLSLISTIITNPNI